MDGSLLSSQILKIVIIVSICLIIYIVFNNITKRVFKIDKIKKNHSKKNKTLISMFNNIIKYFVVIIALIAILNVVGINTTSLIASLGVMSAVFALAFQDTLKDFLAGIMIISEDQYDIGDNVTINGFRGEVMSVGLRTTKLKAYNGEYCFIANHNIDNVINHSLAKNLAIVTVDVAYDSDLDKVEEVLNNLCERLKTELEDVRGDVRVDGIEDLGSSGITYRVVAEVLPIKNYDVQRKMRKAIKQELDKFGITIPYPQVVVHNGL